MNDGNYGNTDSWIANAADPNNPNPGIGVAFPASQNVTSVSWGRDNGNTAGDCCGGQLMDRSMGTYTLQRTTVAAPGAGTAVTGVAATGWENIGTFTYYGNTDTTVGGGFSAFLRHEYQIALNGGAVAATGLRHHCAQRQRDRRNRSLFRRCAVGHSTQHGELQASSPTTWRWPAMEPWRLQRI